MLGVLCMYHRSTVEFECMLELITHKSSGRSKHTIAAGNYNVSEGDGERVYYYWQKHPGYHSRQVQTGRPRHKSLVMYSQLTDGRFRWKLRGISSTLNVEVLSTRSLHRLACVMHRKALCDDTPRTGFLR